MAYLLTEILGSLVIVGVVGFVLGWFLRGLKQRVKDRRSRGQL